MMQEWAITVYKDGDARIVKVQARTWKEAVDAVLRVMKQFRNVS